MSRHYLWFTEILFRWGDDWCNKEVADCLGTWQRLEGVEVSVKYGHDTEEVPLK